MRLELSSDEIKKILRPEKIKANYWELLAQLAGKSLELEND